MARLRLLDSYLRQISRPRGHALGFASVLGEEACRVTTTIHLAGGDRISDVGPTVASDLLQDRPLAEILHHAYTRVAGRAGIQTTESRSQDKSRLAEDRRHARMGKPADLPHTPLAMDRLHLAIGAAAVLKAATSPGRISPRDTPDSMDVPPSSNLVLAYVSTTDLSTAEWRQVFALLKANSLPLLIVILPNRSQTANSARRAPMAGQISRLSARSGIPGILVDCDDPIALYRVATESIGRIRSGDGAVVIECTRSASASVKGKPQHAIDNLRQALLARRLVTTGWFDRTEEAFRKRLIAADR